jgi:Ca-activated chloride channel family protein
MVNYESTVIEANQALVASGRDPLYIVYLVDGTAIADSPFAYIDKDDPEKEATFQGLQRHLLSDEVQRELLGRGRRAGLGINPDPSTIDPAVFNPDWGIDTTRILTPVKIPDPAVVREALDLYQTAFRKPSFTVFALDFSGSMDESNGEDELKAAMRLLLDQETAAQYLLQASPDDVTVIILFNDLIVREWTLIGNDPVASRQLADQIDQVQAGGGTDIYPPVMRGFDWMRDLGTDGLFPSIVLMTDGRSGGGNDFSDLEQHVAANGMGHVPVFAITFGDASKDQLDQIAALTSGAVFDGRGDLAGAFRAVRGYT